MTQDLASLYIKVDSNGVVTAGKNLDDLTDKSKKTEKATDSLRSSFDKLGKQLNTYAKYAAAAATALAIYQIQKQTRIAISLASELQEVQGKFDVVFAGQRKEAEMWAKALVGSYAMSTIEAKKYLSSVQDLLVPMGMSSVSAGKLSSEIVKLAADLGSFNNLPTEQVMLNIQSALTGEYESMKKYGVILNATTVQQKALTMGFADTEEQLTAGMKAQAAYAIMVENSTAALGDMERTMGSAANQEKQQQALLADISTLLGQSILPYYQELITLTNNWLLANKSVIEQNIPHYIEKVGDAIVFATNVMRFFHNAWLGIKLVGVAAIQGIATALKGLFELFRLIQKPLDLMFSGLEKLGAIDNNPFEMLSDSLETFRLSSGDVTKQIIDDIESTNRTYDSLIDKINKMKEALIAAPSGVGQDSGTLPVLQDAGPSLFISQEDAQSEADDLLKMKIDLYDGMSAYENEYREAQIEWIYRVRDAQIEAGLDEAAARIKATKEIQKIDQEAFESKTAQVNESLGQMGSAFQTIGNMYDKSSGSYDKMQKAAQVMMIAQQGVAVANAVAAIANQGMGDPYTAFSRIAAMTSAMVGLLASAGMSFGGGSSSSGGYTKPSGTALGGGNSESTGNAYELLQDTYDMQYRELSGLNRSMLELNDNISGLVSNVFQMGIGAGESYLGEAGINIIKSFGLTLSETGVAGLKSGGGVDSGLYKNILAYDFAKKSTRTEYEAIAESTEALLTSIYQGISTNLIDLTSQFGTDIETTLAYTFESATLDLQGKTPDQVDELLQSYFSGLADTAVESLFGSIISGYQEVGEGLYETAIRLVTDKAIIVDMLDKTGQAFTGTIPEIIEFSETLISMAGDLDTLRDSFEVFYSEFIPESEQFVNLQNDLTGALTDLNTILPDTRDGYMDLVQGLDLTTQAGQQAYVVLLGLSESAADYYSQLEDMESDALGLREDRLKLEIALLEAQGESELALAMARQSELDSMDESLQAIQAQIWAQQDLNDTMETLEALQSEQDSLLKDRFTLQMQLLEAQGESESALALSRQSELDVMDESLQALQKQIWAQQDLNDAMETYTTITEALSSAISDISGNATVSTQAGFNTLFTQAMGGDTEALTALPAAAKTFLSSAYSMSQSELDYRRLESQVLNKLAQAADFSSSQIAVLDASVPGHATGLNQVPYDGYLMKAHKDEAVLTAPEADQWRKSKSERVTSLTEFRQMKQELRGLREVMESGNYQVAKNTLKISKILGRFDDDGMPAERLV